MNPTSAAAWDAYWRIERADYVNHVPQLIEALNAHVAISQSSILEIGAGTGGDSIRLAQQGAKVSVLDFASEALARIQQSADAAGVTLRMILADARALPCANATYDAIFHQGFLEHFTDPAALVQEQRRVLRRGGYLLVDVPQRYNFYTLYKRRLIQLGRWQYGGWEREFSYLELKRLLQANSFSIVTAYGRGYFPRPFEIIHNLPNAETRLLKRRLLPESIWQPYRKWWEWFETSPLGIWTLQSIGVLARAE